MARKSAGKWAALRGQIPTLPPSESYAEAVQAIVADLDGTPPGELVTLFDEAKAAEEAAKLDAKRHALTLEAVTRLLDRYLELHGLDGLDANGYHYAPTIDIYPSVKDRETFLAWARETMPDVLREEFPWQTLKALTKSRLETGDAPPPGVDIFLKKTFTRR